MVLTAFFPLKLLFLILLNYYDLSSLLDEKDAEVALRLFLGYLQKKELSEAKLLTDYIYSFFPASFLSLCILMVNDKIIELVDQLFNLNNLN